MGHCVSRDFLMEAAVAAKLNQLYPQIKQISSQNQTPRSVFAYYDRYSRRWIYNLATKFRFIHKLFYEPLSRSIILMQNHEERQGNKHISLANVGCGLDNPKWHRVYQIISEVFQHSPIKITVCTVHCTTLHNP